MDIEPTTVVFETINFLVLTLLLWRLLYRPLRESIAARRAVVEADLAHAEQARAEAEQLEATWRAREDELAALRAQARREALDDAERERARILTRAREDAAQEHARVSQLLEAEHEAAARWVRSAVWSRGTELAGRMMLALAPEHLDQALWSRLLDVIARTGELADEEPEVEVCGARMAERPELDALRGVLEGRLAGAPRITVREDGDLIAGWTVRIGDRLFDASVAGELEAFRDLARALEDEAA